MNLIVFRSRFLRPKKLYSLISTVSSTAVAVFHCMRPSTDRCSIGKMQNWCVCLPDVSSPLVSHCFPLSPWMVCPPSEVLSPIVSPHVCLCWMVRPPSPGLVSPCFPLCLDGVPAFPRSHPSLLLSPKMCPLSRGLLSQLVFQLVFLLVSQLVSQLVCLLVSFCGGWSHLACFPKQCTVRVRGS